MNNTGKSEEKSNFVLKLTSTRLVMELFNRLYIRTALNSHMYRGNCFQGIFKERAIAFMQQPLSLNLKQLWF